MHLHWDQAYLDHRWHKFILNNSLKSSMMDILQPFYILFQCLIILISVSLLSKICFVFCKLDWLPHHSISGYAKELTTHLLLILYIYAQAKTEAVNPMACVMQRDRLDDHNCPSRLYNLWISESCISWGKYLIILFSMQRKIQQHPIWQKYPLFSALTHSGNIPIIFAENCKFVFSMNDK